MKKVLIASALLVASAPVSAAIVQYNITGGNWDSVTSWNNNANASESTFTYDNGETPELVGATAQLVGWNTATPGAQTGTYGGTIFVDDTDNAVVSGNLDVTGNIADMVVVSGNTWWLRETVDLNIDFATANATASAVNCYGTALAPAPCGDAVIGGLPEAFEPLGGIASQDPAGAGGTTYPGATFDPATGLLEIFHDGRTAGNPGGTDSLFNFTLTFTTDGEPPPVIPVPAAVWLFGSAVGLMGFARRRVQKAS